MVKCSICNEDLGNATDLEFFYHVGMKHKKELEETSKNISKIVDSNKKLLQKNKKEGI